MTAETYKKEYILYKIGDHYLLLRNRYPDPRSFQENIAQEIWKHAEKQADILVEHYQKNYLGSESVPIEIGRQESLPIGEDLYADSSIEDLEIFSIAETGKYKVFGTSEDPDSFKADVLADDEYSPVRGSNHVESYRVYFMPSELMRDVYDIDKYFRGHIRYDYEAEQWVST